MNGHCAADVKELAQQYVPAAVAELARLATSAESETARVSAIRELLDRACGKATQAIDAEVDLTVDDKVRAKIEGEVYANIYASINSTGERVHTGVPRAGDHEQPAMNEDADI